MKDISAKLRKEIPEFESGKIYKFKLNGLRYNKHLKRMLVPNSIKILAQDTIYDPHLNRSVEIKCVDRTAVGKDGSQVEILRKIYFNKDMAGVMTLYGNNKKDKALFEYLWLSNYNSANTNKPWFQKPVGGCKYEYLEPNKSASQKVEDQKAIHEAETVVFNLSDDDLRIACSALGKSSSDDFKYHHTMHEAQMREKLLAYAKKNPNRVKMLDKDLNLEVRAAIRSAVDAGVISFDERNKLIVWTNTGNKICSIEPGKDAETTLVGYFVTSEGEQVLKTILANLQGEESKSTVKGRKKTTQVEEEA
jgi:hypothetical protein